MSTQAYSLTGVVSEVSFTKPINSLNFREAMGLGAAFMPSSVDNNSQLYQHYRNIPINTLVAKVEDPALAFADRWVCGQLLALFGDRRIDPLAPQMLSVQAGKVVLGLAPEDVDRVLAEFSEYGVLREWIEKETPTYEQTLAAYRMAKYPVTNAEFLIFLTETGYPELPTSWRFGRFPAELSNHPVFTLSTDAVEAYIDWLNHKTSRQFRLPSEAEWECAAAGPQRWTYPWGDIFAADHANTVESGILTSNCVGLFPKGNGPFGHCDLAGNIEEYVADDYQPYPNGPHIKDDLLNNADAYRIARGGSFTRFRDLARTRRRHGNYGSELYAMGFRLAESI